MIVGRQQVHCGGKGFTVAVCPRALLRASWARTAAPGQEQPWRLFATTLWASLISD